MTTTNTPVFYKQATLDGTNSAIQVAAQTPPPGTGMHVFTFYDDLCNQFAVNLTNARAYLGMVLEVTDANGAQAGWYHMNSARLTDSQDVLITVFQPPRYTQPPLNAVMQQALHHSQTLAQSVLGIRMGGHLDLMQVPAAAQAMRQRDCDHVWVDVGFFSGKQACKKCDMDRG